MTGRRSLRNRVAVTLAVFGGVVSLALAIIIYWVSHDLERRLVDDTLSAELDDYVERRARNPRSLPERTATIRAFVVTPDSYHSQIPKEVSDLLPGRHRLLLDGIHYRAAVRKVGEQRFVVLYDVSALRRREQGFQLLLACSVILIAAISLAELFPWHEVQHLAADFDSYLLRLHDFIERERLFTGDVSHELRTPLAVIQGATELLTADPNIDDTNRLRIARIDRAVAEMGEISGALLALAREQDSPEVNSGPCDAEDVAAELVSRYSQLLRGKPVELLLEVVSPPQVAADHAVLAMVLGNLLRNALTFTDSGEVKIRLEADAIEVTDTGQGLGSQDIQQLFRAYVRGAGSSGAGLGLSLVQRLCERQGWQVTLATQATGGTLARLDFRNNPPEQQEPIK
ncbi:MAG: HAMP domain-containing sensor histidine kinase [Gammaproteobacteria bacterium]